MKRWDWTWEERQAEEVEQPLAAIPQTLPPSPSPPPPSTPAFGRRRAVAALAIVAVLVLLASVIAGHDNGHHGARTPPVRHAVSAETTAQRAVKMARAEEQAIDHVLSYTPAVTAGGSHGDEVALTFDDGPGPYTQRLVGVLNRLHVKATFFAIGKEERYFSTGTLLELRSGDVLGDHTESHPMMAALSRHEQYEQLTEQMAHIELLGGARPRLFRPPYGSFDATTFKLLHSLHLLMVLWSTDTDDYTLPGASAIEQSALAGAHPGAIILMHDAGGDRSETIAALPAIVKGLHERGLRPVTIPRLMLDDPPPRGLPIPSSLTGD